MSKSSRSAPTSADEAHRRAAGRRRYNSIRTLNKQLRRREIAELLLVTGRRWGVQAKIARSLGVSEATVSRDIKAIFERELHPCPACDRVYDRDEWKDLAARGKVELTENGVRLPCARAQPLTRPLPASIAALEYLRTTGDVSPEDEDDDMLVADY